MIRVESKRKRFPLRAGRYLEDPLSSLNEMLETTASIAILQCQYHPPSPSPDVSTSQILYTYRIFDLSALSGQSWPSVPCAERRSEGRKEVHERQRVGANPRWFSCSAIVDCLSVQLMGNACAANPNKLQLRGTSVPRLVGCKKKRLSVMLKIKIEIFMMAALVPIS